MKLPERFHVESRFINDTERDYFDGMRKFLRTQLGVKSIIVATSLHNHTSSSYPLLPPLNLSTDMTIGSILATDWLKGRWSMIHMTRRSLICRKPQLLGNRIPSASK